MVNNYASWLKTVTLYCLYMIKKLFSTKSGKNAGIGKIKMRYSRIKIEWQTDMHVFETINVKNISKQHVRDS